MINQLFHAFFLASEGRFWPPRGVFGLSQPPLPLSSKVNMPLSSHKTFATNSLKYTFVWDVWLHGQIVYSMIEHLSIINEMSAKVFFVVPISKEKIRYGLFSFQIVTATKNFH